MSTTTSKGTGNTTEAGGRVVFEQALFKLLNTPENYVGEMNRNANALRDIYATLRAERDALRDELDLTKAGLEFAKDAAFRLSGIAAEQYSKSDVEAICSIAIAAVNRQNKAMVDALKASNAALVEALTKLIKEFDDMDEHRPLHAGCVQCTEGATPDRYNTGPCAYHAARAALASVKA